MGTQPSADDPRVRAALAVLAGEDVAAAAARWDLDPRLVRRWTEQFVRGGTAAVRNEPVGDEAQARDRLLAAINHELRTPLTKMQGYASLLVRDRVDEEQAADMRAEMRSEFLALNQLLSRLDETTGASLGRLVLDREVLELSALLADIDVPVTIHDDREVEVDLRRVRTVVDDLLALGRRGPQTERLELTATADDIWADIVVVRHGAPFDPSRLAAELDPFAPRDGHSDITFGMHLATALTVLHGGQLGVRRVSDHDELWLRLPVRPPHEDRMVVPLRR